MASIAIAHHAALAPNSEDGIYRRLELTAHLTAYRELYAPKALVVHSDSVRYDKTPCLLINTSLIHLGSDVFDASKQANSPSKQPSQTVLVADQGLRGYSLYAWGTYD